MTSLPFTLFCIRKTPEEVGCLPYGAPITESGLPEGISSAKAFKTPVFYAVFLFAGLINALTMVAQQFPTYTKQLEGVPYDALAVGVMMATVMMVAQAVCRYGYRWRFVGMVRHRKRNHALCWRCYLRLLLRRMHGAYPLRRSQAVRYA